MFSGAQKRYDEEPTCAFTGDRLHFAAHVRMGDRRAFQQSGANYFELLESIMGTVTAEVVAKGLPEPMFHVFSETVVPCPSGLGGTFEEFPVWPVGVDKVRKEAATSACACLCSFLITRRNIEGVPKL